MEGDESQAIKSTVVQRCSESRVALLVCVDDNRADRPIVLPQLKCLNKTVDVGVAVEKYQARDVGDGVPFPSG